MKGNIGSKDQAIRTIGGLTLIVLGYYLNHVWWLFLVGDVFIITAYFRVCPFYKFFRINSHTPINLTRYISSDREKPLSGVN
jgi:hypothetical protein